METENTGKERKYNQIIQMYADWLKIWSKEDLTIAYPYANNALHSGLLEIIRDDLDSDMVKKMKYIQSISRKKRFRPLKQGPHKTVKYIALYCFKSSSY
jgi:hypothetical protein